MQDVTMQPTSLTRPYWDAAEAGRLARQVCDDCGRNFFTPQIACPACQSEAWRWVESSGRGTIYSLTTVHKGPTPELPAPYVLAVVMMDEGWTLLTNIVNLGTLQPSIGMGVRAVFQRRWNGLQVPEFEPSVPQEPRT
jgi:uncharacterized OB-fold protein